MSTDVRSLILGAFILFTFVAVLAVWLFRRRTRGIAKSGENGNRTLDIAEVRAEVGPREIFFGTSAGLPALSFYSLKTRDLPKNKRQIELGQSLTKLGPAVQMVASMLPAAALSSGKYMRVVVNGPLARAGDGSAYLPFVRGADGKVSELARLINNSQLCQLANACMLWQVASVIVAQKHLADISEKLSEIKEGINDIKEFLQDERKSKMTGSLKYLEQVAQRIMQGELPDHLISKLEDIEGKMLEVQDHLMEEVTRLTDGIDRIEHSDRVGTRKFTEKIEKYQKHLYQLHKQLILCAYVRAANSQVWSAFPGEQRGKIIRNERILSSIEEFTPLFERANTMVQKKIGDVNAVFNFQETLDERRHKLERQRGGYKEEICSSATRVRTLVLEIGNRLSSVEKPTVLALKVSGGSVLEAYELEETPTQRY